MPSTSEHRAPASAGDDGLSALERLEAAETALEDIEAEIERHGPESVEDVADAYRRAASLLDSYVDRASGTGREEFRSYVELEGKFGTLVEGLSEGLARREAFEDAWEAIDKRRLDESDFEAAKDALEPARKFADLLDKRERAANELTAARRAATDRLQAVTDELNRLEDLESLAAIDLDAPVDELRDPIEGYNEGVRDAFDEYIHEATAREVFSFLDRTDLYPLVAYDPPPDHLRRYVETAPAGTETIPQLLKYADYSRSKLDHYVDDAGELKRRVGTEITYLSSIDAEPLTVEWPPPPAERLQWRIRELLPLVNRIGDGSIAAALRTVRNLTRSSDYADLQQAARARAELTEAERRRIKSGQLEDDREALQRERSRLEELLDR